MVTVVCVESANVYKGHIVIIQIRYFLRADFSTFFVLALCTKYHVKKNKNNISRKYLI